MPSVDLTPIRPGLTGGASLVGKIRADSHGRRLSPTAAEEKARPDDLARRCFTAPTGWSAAVCDGREAWETHR